MSDPDAKVYVVRHRKRTDVTEEVKTVLDLLHSSLDWGSGFLCAEDIEAWGKIAGALGMDVKGIQEQIDELRENERIDRIQKKFTERTVVYQARSKNNEVLAELTAPSGQGVAWVPPPGTKKPVYWWRNQGWGWENLGRYPV